MGTTVEVRANDAAVQAFQQQLQAQGLKTTHINWAGGEADFSDYGAALSPQMQQEILASFDCEDDYAMQQRIAGIYTQRSVYSSKDFVAACRSLGYEVSISYEGSQHLIDAKANGGKNQMSGTGVAVYTIIDPNSKGAIKIADANGNGYLECEELFMNNILGDINAQIGYESVVTMNGSTVDYAAVTAGTQEFDYTFGQDPQRSKKVSQDDFNAAVDKFITIGYSVEEAIARANADYSVNMKYTGENGKTERS